MHPILDSDRTALAELTASARAVTLDYLQSLDVAPAARVKQSAEATRIPPSYEGIGAAATLTHFQTSWLPRLASSAGPRYLGFVTGGATPASLIGDWLTSAVDQNPQSHWDSDAPELEHETVRRLATWFGLASHTGTFVTGATMSNFVGLAIGREWVGDQRNISVSDEGLAALGPVAIYSARPHSSVHKAASMLGLGRRAVISVPSFPGREAIDVAALEAILAAHPCTACIVVATLGTVNSGDFDDIDALADLQAKYPFWLHVDGAFGAFAALDPRLESHVRALDRADSVCIDCHKWMNVPYDSALQFTRRRDLQVRVFQNAATYLGNVGANPNFVHLTPENSRRWRALAAWFSITAYGRQGHADIVVRNIDSARALGERILAELDAYLVLLAPVRLNVVLFTLRDSPDEARLLDLLAALRDSGETFMTPTCFEGTWAMRAAFSNWQTTPADGDRIFEALKRAVVGSGD
ncbi:pyridoxal-dependent decarboxylase [Achlya hypogyna]|uniref:Pyridoxal-dependent decarboxylase n=1 Tax=Achlya hypogyna TaxID=1202772 RepID=A0A1V9ZU92_ACHHY|nr:pyridoxal-dependent decarboxylase [Achlya hypogyna]